MASAIVIDDDDDVTQSLAYLLEMKNIDVVGVAYDGKEGASLYKEKHPDATILDMDMPDYDGNYAIEKIKEENPNAKIIVVTGYPKKKPKASEVAAIYDKPYNILEIIEAVSN